MNCTSSPAAPAFSNIGRTMWRAASSVSFRDARYSPMLVVTTSEMMMRGGPARGAGSLSSAAINRACGSVTSVKSSLTRVTSCLSIFVPCGYAVQRLSGLRLDAHECLGEHGIGLGFGPDLLVLDRQRAGAFEMGDECITINAASFS